MTQILIDQLRSTRDDYAEETRWHRFLLDAQYGTGGFKGRFAPTDVSVMGWAAQAYARYTGMSSPFTIPDGAVRGSISQSYLDQFAREDAEKFGNRRAATTYRNYVGPVLQVLISYINEKPMHRSTESAKTQAWRSDCDGNGTDWDTMLNEVIRPRAANPGWCPVLLDMPSTFAGQSEVMLSDVQQQQVMPRVIPLYPCNVLLTRENDAGEIIAAKIRIDREVGGDLLGGTTHEEHYSLWYQDRVERYVVQSSTSGPETVTGPETIQHSWGIVPLFFFRGEATPGDRMRGRSIVADMAMEARTHFNLGSEKRDHERAQVFAILGVPVRDLATPIGDIIAGNGSAIKVPADANMMLHFVAPPATVASTLETSISTSVQEMYRISRVEYDEPGAGSTQSGIARAYRFRATNSRLRDMANGWARAEQDLLRSVDRAMGTAKPEVTVTAAADYSIEDLQTDLANAMSAITMPIGPTAKAEISKRILRRVIPNLPTDMQAQIDEEIDAEALQAEQNAAAMRELSAVGAAAAANSPGGQGAQGQNGTVDAGGNPGQGPINA